MPTERKQKSTNEKWINMEADATQTSGMQLGMQIAARGRFWSVHDRHGQLVCVTVYKKGAREVVRRLSLMHHARPRRKASAPARRAAPPTRKRLPCGRHVAMRGRD